MNADRESIARIIDPEAADYAEAQAQRSSADRNLNHSMALHQRRTEALAKADAILAIRLAIPPAGDRGELRYAPTIWLEDERRPAKSLGHWGQVWEHFEAQERAASGPSRHPQGARDDPASSAPASVGLGDAK